MIRILPLILIFAAALLSCKKEASAPAVREPAKKVQAAQPIRETVAAVKPEEKKEGVAAYPYDPRGRRDPFLSIIAASKKEQEADRKKKGVKPAESYDVSDIKVIAIAWDKNRYYAMVELPDKKYFTLKEGMAIGLHNGKVLKIDPKAVLVREYIKNYKGEVQPKDSILQLRTEEEK